MFEVPIVLVMKALVFVYFSMALLFLIFRTKVFKSPSLFLFRSLFPNWKFFDQFGYLPRLQFRVQIGNELWSDWKEFHGKAKLNLLNIFFNPFNNLILSEQSIVQQVVGDLDTFSAKELEKASSYLILKMIVSEFVRTKNLEAKYFQFRIQAVDFSSLPATSELLLLSPEYKMESVDGHGSH